MFFLCLWHNKLKYCIFVHLKEIKVGELNYNKSQSYKSARDTLKSSKEGFENDPQSAQILSLWLPGQYFNRIHVTAEQSGVLIRILGEELSEPGLHDELLPIKMCEVILQGGNVRLETSNSESEMCLKVCDCVRLCAVIFSTYPHPSDALQLCLRQVSN